MSWPVPGDGRQGDGRLEDIVLLSTADWDNPFWTNKQHVAADLAARGHRVLYVDSLGLRRPSATAADAGRVLRRLSRALTGPRQVRPRLHVWSPVAVPLQRHRAVRRINRAVLGTMLAAHLRRLGLRRQILWTYSPLTPDLLDLGGFETVVYHCVDEVKAQPGMPAEAIEAAEGRLITRADIVFVTSPRLAETRGLLNSNTVYLPNVADFDHFARAMDPSTPMPADLLAIPPPRLGFVGAISRYKVDVGLLRTLALARPDWSIVLIGKVGEGDPWGDVAELSGLSNLHLLGPRPYAELPAYLKGIDVALLPSALNAYTAAMFPMKFFEYLAAGRPVVATDLPALAAFRDLVWLTPSPGAFVEAVAAALAGGGPSLEARQAAARAHTYQARNDTMLARIRAIRAAGCAGRHWSITATGRAAE